MYFCKPRLFRGDRLILVNGQTINLIEKKQSTLQFSIVSKNCRWFQFILLFQIFCDFFEEKFGGTEFKHVPVKQVQYNKTGTIEEA